MYCSLRLVRKLASSTHAGPNLFARAIFFAKINLFLVVASVLTTSLFYISLIVAASVFVGEDNTDETKRRAAFVFISWLMDSLFNDACVLFVGFGPISDSLTTIREATAPDVIGAPALHFNEPEDQEFQNRSPRASI